MIQLNNNFVGREPNTVLNFCSCDSERLYYKNLEEQPDDWYYRDNQISYNHNSLGHRCKNIEDIDLDNYILFSGCSFVEGLGLELEKTFPYLVSTDLNTDYYNLGLSASGIDTMTHNLIVWLNTVKKLPKAVVILWTFEDRFATMSPHSNDLKFNIPRTVRGNEARFLALGTQIGYFNSRRNLNSRLVNQLYRETTIIELEVADLNPYDLARDLKHPGIISHQILAKKVIHKLNK